MSRKATQWSARIAAWQRSGSSQARFCRERGLSLSSFGYWRRRLSHEAPSRSSALVPVVVSGPAVSATAEVCVPNGLRVRVPLGSDPQAVGALVRALAAC